MHLSLRTKLTLIVVATAFSLASAIALSLQLAARQSQNVEDLEQRLVPKLELEPRLAAQFEQLGQALRDGVAAQDRVAIEATDELRDAMYSAIERAGPALDPAGARELRDAIRGYHRTAAHVSRRLLDGEAGEDVVNEMSAMQEQHKRTVAAIEHFARLDRATLRSGFAALQEAGRDAARSSATLGLISLTLIVGLSTWLGRGALRSLGRIAQGFERFAAGRLDEPIAPISDDELGALARQANDMASALDRLGKQRDVSDWIRAGQVDLAERLRGEMPPEQAARCAVGYLAERVGALAGALYLDEGDGTFGLSASHAFPESDAQARTLRFALGQGLVGQAALRESLQVVDAVPDGYLSIRSGLGQSAPRCLVLVPLCRGARAVGVVELALLGPCSDPAREFLGLVSENVAVTLDSARSRAKLRALLEESQTLATRLAAQEEELVQSNSELSAQQEDLRLANDELEAQRGSLARRNDELEQVRTSLQQQADELAQVSSYKSQFLANMSHELRTPLNSMLLLSQILAGNDAGNLSPKQIEHCRTIYSAGKGLLALINQVLDLSKIESGKQELDVSEVVLSDLGQHLRSIFEPQFTNKGLTFSLFIAPELPPVMHTDGLCLQRVLVNLLGNALKFTERGGVSLRITRPAPSAELEKPGLDMTRCIAFGVVDTGIGIAEGARARIFGRFEQADARTVRRYGGTGLGLAIARESVQLMGGELTISSVEGQGSVFTCVLPERLPSSGRVGDTALPPSTKPVIEVTDDRANLADGEPHLLIVEDDPSFAQQLLAVVRRLELKAVVASNGQEALRLARSRAPAGIVLDVVLPGIDGFVVREELRNDPLTAGIPVHFVSALEAPRGWGSLGAVGFLTKPASASALVEVIQTLTRPQVATSTRVLLVEDDEAQSQSITDVLAQFHIDTRRAASAEEAVRALESESFGCIILDLGLPDVDGLRWLEQLEARGDLRLPPVIVHTGRTLSRDEEERLREYAEAVVSKEKQSMGRLLAEVQSFVGRLLPNPSSRPEAAKQPPPSILLEGVKVLIADDDMRTVYALCALLRDRGADVIVAETGREALRALDEHVDVRAVLMDIMMPDMDGYEALRQLREQPRFAELPVIALTARAIQGEKERCEAAGASEHMTKPINPIDLLSSLEQWLGRQATPPPGVSAR